MESLKIKDRIIRYGMTFEEYQRLQGVSHSDIRMDGRAPFKPTAKMNLGTSVHDYLLSPASYQHDNIKVVKPIAVALKAAIGDLWRFLQCEIAATATFCIEGFEMIHRGRIDLGIERKIVIDLKVINGESVKNTIDLFHYDTQISGYGLDIDAKVALLIAYSTKTKQTETIAIPIKSDWWALQTITRGKPILV